MFPDHNFQGKFFGNAFGNASYCVGFSCQKRSIITKENVLLTGHVTDDLSALMHSLTKMKLAEKMFINAQGHLFWSECRLLREIITRFSQWQRKVSCVWKRGEKTRVETLPVIFDSGRTSFCVSHFNILTCPHIFLPYR